MYFAKKSEYNDIREKSFLQWLDEMEKHDDVACLLYTSPSPRD